MKRGLIIALDIPGKAARRLVKKIGAAADFYKVPPAATLEDPGLVPWLLRQKKRVFLDCKWHDIPSQVKRSVEAAGRTGVTAVTVHAGGGLRMMRAAVAASPRPLVWGVTVLTSMERTDLKEIGISALPRRQVLRLARLARSAGLDGLVCSPKETAFLRKEGIRLPLITPGISFGGRAGADQRRTATPAQAWKAGSTLLVVGRSVLDSPDPRATIHSLTAERPNY